jgi:hypothetical protein
VVSEHRCCGRVRQPLRSDTLKQRREAGELGDTLSVWMRLLTVQVCRHMDGHTSDGATSREHLLLSALHPVRFTNAEV